MTTKPFDPSKPAQTRDGRPVRILCTDAKNKYSIFGLVTNGDGTEEPTTWTADGSFRADVEADGCVDLINVPTKRKGWIGVWRNELNTDSFAWTTCVYPTQSQAYEAADRRCPEAVQIKEIEFDE